MTGPNPTSPKAAWLRVEAAQQQVDKARGDISTLVEYWFSEDEDDLSRALERAVEKRCAERIRTMPGFPNLVLPEECANHIDPDIQE